MALHLRLFYCHFLNQCPWLASYNWKCCWVLVAVWKCCFLNRSIPCQRHSDKVCPYKKKQQQTNKQKLQPRIEPGLENLTHPITSTLPRRHNSKQEKFDYVIILPYPLVIQSITFELLFKFSLKKENLILVLLFPVSGGTTRTTFGSFQLQQKLLPAGLMAKSYQIIPNKKNNKIL